MKDDYTTNSRYITHTIAFWKVGRIHFLSSGVKGFSEMHYLLPVASSLIWSHSQDWTMCPFTAQLVTHILPNSYKLFVSVPMFYTHQYCSVLSHSSVVCCSDRLLPRIPTQSGCILQSSNTTYQGWPTLRLTSTLGTILRAAFISLALNILVCHRGPGKITESHGIWNFDSRPRKVMEFRKMCSIMEKSWNFRFLIMWLVLTQWLINKQLLKLLTEHQNLWPKELNGSGQQPCNFSSMSESTQTSEADLCDLKRSSCVVFP